MADHDSIPDDYADALRFELVQKEMFEDAREQGRREVYAEIAKLEQTQTGGSPIYDTACLFCGGKPWQALPHDSSCLWLRARAAMLESAAKANDE